MYQGLGGYWGLQNKVVDLETMLDVAKKELWKAYALQKEAGEIETDSEAEPPSEKATDVVGEKQCASLGETMTEWKKGVEGQWALCGRNGFKSLRARPPC